MIEAILELLRSLFTHGISWGALIAFIVALNKFQRANQYKHWNATISHNQKIIMERLNIGDQWIGNGNTEILSKEQIKTFKKLYSSLHKVSRQAYQSKRRKKLMERLKSRKLWIAVISAVLLVLKEGFDINVDSEVVLSFAGIVITAILGFAHVDGKKEMKKDAPTIDTSEFEG